MEEEEYEIELYEKLDGSYLIANFLENLEFVLTKGTFFIAS